MSSRAIFLDRDGTINTDKDYLYRISDFEFIPGCTEALRALTNAGYRLIIISNQSGIARGYYTEADYLALDEWLKNTLRAQGIELTATYYCPHLPDAPVERYRMTCTCRKPAIGLYEKAIREWDIDPSLSYAIGDRMRDLEICKSTGCRGFLLNTTEPEAIIDDVKKGIYPDIRYAADLSEAASDILASPVWDPAQSHS